MRRRRSTRDRWGVRPIGFSACVLVFACVRPSIAAEPPVIVSHYDAYVAHADSSDTWFIGSAALELGVGLDASGMLTLQSLSNPVSNRSWNIAPAPDVTITIGNDNVTLGSFGGVTFRGAIAEETDTGVRLTLNFEHRLDHVRIARIYACYPGSPTIETWTHIDAAAATRPVQVSGLVGWRMTMPLGQLQWINGLQGDSPDNQWDDAFGLVTRGLDPGEHLELGADGRSSEQFVPFAIVDDGRDQFFGGIMWSGSWRIGFDRVDDRVRVSTFFPVTAPLVPTSRGLDVPHTFFGVTPRSTGGVSTALKPFILGGIRHGRPFQPLVTYNSWFAYGTAIDEGTMTAEMDRAASLGVELFVVDAGWWVGAGADGPYDFDSGLGSWQVDDARFPSGLANLASYAHDLGMKFGLWIEPERVALETVDRPGLARGAWLASHQGEFGSERAAQLCLASPQARQYVLARVFAFIDAVGPDYLKWDNNFWINCDRDGHGHGSTDGNFSHVQALYDVLSQVRDRYPDLLIENVSGGGNRLDFGILAYTDVGWMDDRTAPSSRVRHNVEGLSFAFPPAYLLSFVVDSETEPIRGGNDLSLVVRSRMMGSPGLTYQAPAIDATLSSDLSREIQFYKTYRAIVANSTGLLLSDQAPLDVDRWDLFEEIGDDARGAVMFAFKEGSADGRIVVRPRALRADTTYDATALDVGPLGSARGDVLMQDGIELVHAGGSRAHVIILTAR